MQLVYPAVNHPCHLSPFLAGTVVLSIPRKGDSCNSSKWNCITVLEEEKKPWTISVTNPWIISVIWFHIEFMIVLWRMSSFWYWDSLQHYLTLVHHFKYFVVLGCAHHSCNVCWVPMWVFTCHFISISCFTINICEASC